MLTPKDMGWDKETDVIIIGYGLAGAVAAITAHDAGGRVLIVEKQAKDSHCSLSSISGGWILSPSDVNGAIEHMTALCRAGDIDTGWTDSDTIRAWAEYAVENKDWVRRLGGKIELYCKATEYPQLRGAESMELWRYQGSGLRMMQFIYDQVSRRGIDVIYQLPAQRLMTDESGCVIGVRVLDIQSRKETNIRALKAVILCSGGFEADEQMKLQYLKMYPVYFTGGMANTGDGIKMAQEVGANLWHMNCCSARLVGKFPDFPLAFHIDFGGAGWTLRQVRGVKEKTVAGFVIVDRYGRRYMNENLKLHAAFYELTPYDTHRLEYPRVPSYHIFDRRRMECSPICLSASGAAGPHQLYKWSQDNITELSKGWIIKGETVTDLAAKIGVPPSNLENTLELWNHHCQEGKDRDFSRDNVDLVPIDSPPFYAVKLFPGGPNTQGGPRRNAQAQVIDPFGQRIHGLYSAGECGSIYGMLYPVAGGNLAECVAFGRIAAENAVNS